VDEPLLERILANLTELPSAEELMPPEFNDTDFDWTINQAPQHDQEAGGAIGTPLEEDEPTE